MPQEGEVIDVKIPFWLDKWFPSISAHNETQFLTSYWTLDLPLVVPLKKLSREKFETKMWRYIFYFTSRPQWKENSDWNKSSFIWKKKKTMSLLLHTNMCASMLPSPNLTYVKTIPQRFYCNYTEINFRAVPKAYWELTPAGALLM